jgi:glycosyltransferase involved in cell wall biosynthesis
MIKVGIDARFAVHNRRGIGNYTLKLIQNLAKIDTNNEYILYTNKEDVDNVLPSQSNFRIKTIFPSNYFLWEQIVLPIQAKKDKIEILHCTGNTSPIFLDKAIKLVSTIHDVMFLKDYSELPKSTSYYQRLGRLYRKLIVPQAIRRLSMALTISEFSKKDILKHIPQFDINRIKIVHPAANESFSQVDKIKASLKIRNKFGIDCSYVLTLGALDPRKNTELVIKTYIELKNKNIINEKLLIVGIPNWKQSIFYNIVLESNFKQDIVFLDFVSEDDLVLLYNCASIFLYPSLYEGFGIPLLEAMACGVPVVTSNVTSMPEIAGDAALLINPNNGQELKAAMTKLLDDEKLRNDLIARGLKQAKEYSWMKTAEQTLAIYESVYKEQSAKN